MQAPADHEMDCRFSAKESELMKWDGGGINDYSLFHEPKVNDSRP